MAIAVAISPGVFILLLYLQNIIAQQCLNNVGYKNSPGLPQQNFQKPSCGLNKIAQNGLNYLQQGYAQQVNYQQPIIQQASVQQASNQPIVNSQQGNSQQPINAIANSQMPKQSNQDMATQIFSTLYNIKQSAQNQRGTRNIVQGNLPQTISYEQLSSTQNQPNPTVNNFNTPQNKQYPMSNLHSEYPQLQPGFTFQFVPTDNYAVQPNQQMFSLPVQKVSTKDQSQSQPTVNFLPSQQAAIQNPVVMIPSIQTNGAHNQPIVLTLQSPQVSSGQILPTLSTSQNPPVIYTVQSQPPSLISQSLPNFEVPNQKQGTNNLPMDKQSLISYVLSQMQNPRGRDNMLTSILPAVLSTKSEKSSSMKALLPLIFNILNEKKSCCGCPHCGCNHNNNNEQTKPEPIINTGYSNQKNYSQQTPVDSLTNTEYVDKEENSNSKDLEGEKGKDVEVSQNSAAISDEEEEGNESEEEYDEE